MNTALQLLALMPSWMDPNWLLERYGQDLFWVALAIIFIECGLLFPILPGDALLFSLGLFIKRAESGEPGVSVNIVVACITLSVVAFLGNVSGYEIGRAAGPGLHRRRFLKEEWFLKTHEFFERYGNRALVIGRFVPIVRTFVTVVAGIGEMERHRFWIWSAVGAALWASGLTLLGYALGNIAFLKHNIEAAVLVIVLFSVTPMVFEWWRHRRAQNRT